MMTVVNRGSGLVKMCFHNFPWVEGAGFIQTVENWKCWGIETKISRLFKSHGICTSCQIPQESEGILKRFRGMFHSKRIV